MVPFPRSQALLALVVLEAASFSWLACWLIRAVSGEG